MTPATVKPFCFVVADPACPDCHGTGKIARHNCTCVRAVAGDLETAPLAIVCPVVQETAPLAFTTGYYSALLVANNYKPGTPYIIVEDFFDGCDHANYQALWVPEDNTIVFGGMWECVPPMVVVNEPTQDEIWTWATGNGG